MTEPKETPADFAGRLAYAIHVEGKTQSRTEREAGLPQGYMTRLLGTSEKARARQILAPGPELIRALADYLHVSFEWLAIGRGPMRAHGWAPTPFERAANFARTNNTRQDAVDAAVEKNRHAKDMTAMDWLWAIDGEARRLDRAGVPRPEVVAKKQKALRKLGKEHAELKAKRARTEKAGAPEETPAPRKRART